MKKLLWIITLPLLLLVSCGDDKGTNGETNKPPGTPSAPWPSDGMVRIRTDGSLTWECTDPDGDKLTYTYHLGTSTDPPEAGTSSDPNPGSGKLNLQLNTTYYWKVVAIDGRSGRTESPVWSFTTMPQATGFRVESHYPVEGEVRSVWAGSGGLDTVYLVGSFGLQIVNFGYPRPYRPKFLGLYTDGLSTARKIWVYPPYALVLTENEAIVLNISDPSSIARVDTLPALLQPVDLSPPLIADGNGGFKRFNYLDLPHVNSWTDWILMFASCVGKTGPGVGGSIRYVGTSGSLVALDLGSTPMREIGRATSLSSTINGILRASADKCYAVTRANGLYVFNVSDSTNPIQQSNFAISAECHAVDEWSYLAIVAASEEGVCAINTLNPASPTLADRFDTPGEALDVLSIYGFILIADGTGGMYAVQYLL